MRLSFLALCLSIALLPSSKAFAYSNDTLKALSNTITWQNLLHIQNGKSLIRDDKFFLSTNGQTSAYKELIASRKAFLDASSKAACKFPARFAFLKQNLADDTYPKAECPELDEYIEKVAPERIEAVFAAEKNPSTTSMMGHLFFKITGQQQDYTPTHALGFFANLHNVHRSLTFIPEALFTGADGLFILEPYNKRAETYQREGRTLQTFDLPLTPEQVKLITLHIWEMKGMNVHYSLKDQNCASALASILMVADPSYQDLLYKPFLTPYDMMTRYEAQQNKPKTLVKYSPASSVAYNIGSRDGVTFQTLEFAPAYNAIDEINTGYGKEVDTKLFTPKIRLFDDMERLEVERFDLYSSRTFIPTDLQDFKLSRYSEVSFENSIDTSDVISPSIKFGVGITASTRLKHKFMPYMYLTEEYKHFEDKHNAALVPEVGFFSYLAERTKLSTSAKRYINSHENDKEREVSARLNHYFSPKFGVRTEWTSTHTPEGAHLGTLQFGLRYHY